MPNEIPIISPDQSLALLQAHVERLLPMQKRALIAIDGNSCAGKTTLASELGARLDANVFHMDDYFLQPHMRTQERLSQPGGNVDAERFFADVLLPASRGETAHVQKYDCHEDVLLPVISVLPKRVVVVEGAYSLHPLLSPHYDLRVFYRIDPVLQAARILARNGAEALKVFQSRWIPLENKYFDELDILSICDLIIEAK
jgi:uridine kinase